MRCNLRHVDGYGQPMEAACRLVLSRGGEALGWQCPVCHALTALEPADRTALRQTAAGAVETTTVAAALGVDRHRAIRVLRRLHRFGMVVLYPGERVFEPHRWQVVREYRRLWSERGHA